MTILFGDCITQLATLPDASVDAVVTDPPYGLEFMGKEWDRLGDIGQASHSGFTDGSGFKGFRLPASYNASANVKCQTCQRWKYDHVGRRCECGPAAVWPNVKAQQGKTMQAWHQAWAAECLRVLKPGGHLLAFGGTRTYHRMACAVEDVGFEIRDSIHWTYGSGFPKSLDVSKAIDKAAGAEREVVGSKVTGMMAGQSGTLNAENGWAGGQMEVPVTAPATDAARRWDGWGTALKPSHEPIVVARKPLTGTVANNVLTHGTGAINVDACRVGTTEDTRRNATGGDNGLLGTSTFRIRERHADDKDQPSGRWPANTVLTHAANCDPDGGCGAGCPVAEMDAQSGVSVSKSGGVAGWQDKYVGGRYTQIPRTGYDDTGSAARFFPTFYYTAKASSAERNQGTLRNHHPTVKPVALMRWLVRLVTPPGGTVLDPFLGSGTTAVAAVLEGYDWIGCEITADYVPIIESRVAAAEARGHQPDLFSEAP